MESYLSSRFEGPAFFDGQYLKLSDPWNKSSPQHIDAASLSRLFPSGFFDVSFAVVRHPLDRLISAYKWHKLEYRELNKNLQFSEWLRGVSDYIQSNSSKFDNHLRHQLDLIPAGSKIFKLEDGLDQVIAYLDAEFGPVNKAIPLKWEKRASASAEIIPSPDDIRLIETLYAWDYHTLGYPRQFPDGLLNGRAKDGGRNRFAIKLPCPTKSGQEVWGDYHLAEGLASALRRQGQEVRLDAQENWDSHRQPGEIDLVIRGKEPYYRRPQNPCVHWLISNPDTVNWRELVCSDHVFVASQPLANKIGKKIGENKVTLLLQAFDRDRVSEPQMGQRISKALFVGMARKQERPCIGYALRTNMAVDLYGPKWEGTPAAHLVKGNFVDNRELGKLYQRYKVVLNDHMPFMRSEGLVSNRIFDVLAAGAAPISDDIQWLPDDLKPWVYTFRDEASFIEAVNHALAEDDSRSHDRIVFAKRMREAHSFDQRTPVILSVIEARALAPAAIGSA